MKIGPLIAGFIMYKTRLAMSSRIIHGGALARPGIVIEATEKINVVTAQMGLAFVGIFDSFHLSRCYKYLIDYFFSSFFISVILYAYNSILTNLYIFIYIFSIIFQ